MGSENAVTVGHKTQRMASSFVDFLKRCHKDGDEFLNHIVRVTGDETWVSFVNVNQRAVQAVDAHTFTKQTE
jgi:hypothetical protein